MWDRAEGEGAAERVLRRADPTAAFEVPSGARWRGSPRASSQSRHALQGYCNRLFEQQEQIDTNDKCKCVELE